MGDRPIGLLSEPVAPTTLVATGAVLSPLKDAYDEFKDWWLARKRNRIARWSFGSGKRYEELSSDQKDQVGCFVRHGE
jgi:hypothetical protein